MTKDRNIKKMSSLEISLWLFFVAFQTIEGIEISCGFGASSNYALWIADERGGLKFPDYNSDEYLDSHGNGCGEDGFVPRVKINNATDEGNGLCSAEDNYVSCKGGIDFGYLTSIPNKTIQTLIIDNYNGVVLQAPQPLPTRKRVSNKGILEVTDDGWKGTGYITTTDINLGVRVATDITPNANYNGYLIQGDAFSNGILKLGWKFAGDIVINFKKNQTIISVTTKAADQGSAWSVYVQISKDGIPVGNDTWIFYGKIDYLYHSVDFNGELNTKMADNGWSFSGTSKLNQASLTSEISGAITPLENEAIRINKEAFSTMKIKNMIFKNSNFEKDFDNDAFQGLADLETITFSASRMEEIPRLDHLLKNLTQLKAIYIENNILPNLLLGHEPILNNLEYLSFQGSGPIELKNGFHNWLQLPNLKYLNFQDSNVKLNISWLEILLWPINSPLKYLDVSYTPLTPEELSKFLHGLKLTRLSAAGLQLKKIPTEALSKINKTIEYLSLRGNSFEKIPEENMFDIILDFPLMSNLKELDLQQCRINYIERGTFDKMPNLERLYISHNSIENIQDAWTAISPKITVLDLSYNSAGAISSMITTFDVKTENNFSKFKELEILDLTNGVFTNIENLIAGLDSKLKGLSICNTGVKNLTQSMFYNLHELVALDMSFNENIELTEPMSFKLFKSLKSLKYLRLKKCRITNTVFCDIRDVLDNTTNPEEYLLKNLEFLDLSRNNIKAIDTKAFRLLPELKVLDLSGNSITSWSNSLKAFNKKLEIVYLDDNKIDTLSPSMLGDIYTLKIVRLGNNPYICDCSVHQLTKKIRETDNGYEICHPRNIIPFTRSANKNSGGYYIDKIPGVFFKNETNPDKIIKRINLPKKFKTSVKNNVKILNFIQQAHLPVKCTDINNMNKALNDFSVNTNCVQILDWSDENYTCYLNSPGSVIPFTKANYTTTACAEDLTETRISLRWVYIAVPVILTMLIVLGLVYWKWWDIRLITKAVKNAAILSFMNLNDYEPVPFQYNVFVSYSDNDRDWILENLLPNLESWNDLKVCLHERDFQVGMSILENIMASIDKSQCIMLVLSQSFIKSQWCQYEMHLAQHRLLETRRDQLILILLEHIPKYKRPKTLQYLMMTKTYIQWPSNAKNKLEVELFWNRVYKALRSSAGGNNL